MPVGDIDPTLRWHDAIGWYHPPVYINTVRIPDYQKELNPGWDGYGGRLPTDAAVETAKHMTLVPGGDGSLQYEIHAGGCDIEISIAPDGKISSVSSNCPNTEIE